MIQHETSGGRVLVTGASGFVARHVIRELLTNGWTVRGTVRSHEKGDLTRAALESEGTDTGRLSFVIADLTEDHGWDEAVDGCRFVQHTASPFPASQPREKFALVPIARGGTLRVVQACVRSQIERIVLTSSVAAVFYGHEGRETQTFGEADVSNVDSTTISPYAVSKTEAERAAWIAVEGTATQLVTVNPSLIMGPVIGREIGTSIKLAKMMLEGRLPALPNIRFGIVDVRDVATAHRIAMESAEAAGRRFIVSAEPLSLMEIAAHLAEGAPRYSRRLPRYRIPDGLVHFAGRFSARAAMLSAEVRSAKTLDTAPARSLLGVRFIPAADAVRATAASLEAHGLLKA